MTTINWKPSAKEMRHWALIIGPALAFVGSLYYFFDWGIFAGGQSFAMLLWTFGAVAFVTGITGTKIGLPAYWSWMGFVYVVSSVIGYIALSIVFALVVTPMAVIARITRRDKLAILDQKAASYWRCLRTNREHDPIKPF